MKNIPVTQGIQQVSPQFQLFFIVVSFICVSFFLHYRTSTFNFTDEAPQIELITPQKLTEFGGNTNHVKTGIYINQFEKFDIVKNEFTFSGFIWFEFNPDIISLKTIEKFSFERGEIHSKSEADTQINHGKLTARYHIRASFSSPIDYRSFPLDDHRIFISLTHQFVTPTEMLFEASQRRMIIDTDLTSFGWQKIDQTVMNGYISKRIDTQTHQTIMQTPIAIFALDIARYGTRNLLSIFLPLLLLFYLALFSFSFKEKELMLSLSAGSVTGILGYRFVIESLSPQVGYSMISDYIFLLFLISSVIIFLYNTIDLFYNAISLRHKQLFIILFHLLISSLSIYLFLL